MPSNYREISPRPASKAAWPARLRVIDALSRIVEGINLTGSPFLLIFHSLHPDDLIRRRNTAIAAIIALIILFRRSK